MILMFFFAANMHAVYAQCVCACVIFHGVCVCVCFS